MESFTRRIEAEEDESDATEFSAISSDNNGFVSHSDELRLDDDFSNNAHDDGLLSTDSTGSRPTLPSPKRMAMFEGPEILQRLNVFEEVEHGGRVVFECQCKAHPMPAFKWYKDDVELGESDRMRIEDSLDTDGTLRLIISNVRKSDEGAYRCKLENQEGVAASTGYLSVTGNSSSSPNAVSTPPLLRAITEESNVSQDSDEGSSRRSSATLEKILTGEYDVTTLPYSQYLELLKDGGGGGGSALHHDPDTISSPNTNENYGGSRTPTEDTPHADDVRNLCTDFPYETHTTVTGDDDVNNYDDRLAAMATSYDEEVVNKPKCEVIFGTPLLSDSKTVFVIEGSGKDFSGEETDSWTNSEEKLDEMANEGGVSGLGFEGGEDVAKTTTECMEFDSMVRGEEPSMTFDSQGDFRGEGGAFEDEKRMKETVIAGRIGMPSDWEFAHYTAEEPEEAEDTPLASLPGEVLALHRPPPVETLRPKFTDAQKEALLEIGVSTPAASQFAVPDKLEPKEVLLLTGVTLLRDALLDGEAQKTDLERRIVDEEEEEIASDFVTRNADDSEAWSLLPEKPTSPVVGEQSVGRSDKSPAQDDLSLAFSDNEGFPWEVSGESTAETKPVGKPETGGATRCMTEMTSGVSSLSSLSNSAIPREEKGDTHSHRPPPDVVRPNGDGMTQATGFHFTNLIPTDLGQSAVATISNWIPEVSISSFLPDLSLKTTSEGGGGGGGKSLDVEEIVAAVDEEEEVKVERMSAIDWCVDWFRYPTVFYVLLVLTMTLVASATQMNPAMVILVVAVCSLLGFRLFPPHALKQKK